MPSTETLPQRQDILNNYGDANTHTATWLASDSRLILIFQLNEAKSGARSRARKDIKIKSKIDKNSKKIVIHYKEPEHDLALFTNKTSP